jgi:acyl CoA:acetate/3-ketoacid CoA transferase alpha subunit
MPNPRGITDTPAPSAVDFLRPQENATTAGALQRMLDDATQHSLTLKVRASVIICCYFGNNPPNEQHRTAMAKVNFDMRDKGKSDREAGFTDIVHEPIAQVSRHGVACLLVIYGDAGSHLRRFGVLHGASSILEKMSSEEVAATFWPHDTLIEATRRVVYH